MFLKYLTTFVLTVILLQPVWSQQAGRTITGTITSGEDTNPLEGVLVSIKGSKTVSGSQADGIYYIPVTAKDSVLIFSHSEFQTREVKLSGANEYNIVLQKKHDSSGTALQPLNTCLFFPTLLYMEKKERVARIHNGYCGPATGRYYVDCESIL
jgi:hypothetical protein